MSAHRRFASLVLTGLLALTGCGTGEAGGTTPDPGTLATVASQTATPAPNSSAAVPERLAFTAKSLDGKEFAGASLAGKPAVLWFWAPWCPKCRAAGPDVAKVAQTVTVVGVAGLSEDTASMRDFVSATKTGGFTHLGGGSTEVWKRFGITSQHTFVLIDSAGAVTYTGSLDAAGLASRVAELR
ncbi:redoxin domain-containing protein [Longispora sp. NPDC051575]|uniref:redoxin domain-containing protein n=1 Tax=Longispora sp. NPDC051575 TaxID=3154943 RepID=UPI0034214ABA